MTPSDTSATSIIAAVRYSTATGRTAIAAIGDPDRDEHAAENTTERRFANGGHSGHQSSSQPVGEAPRRRERSRISVRHRAEPTDGAVAPEPFGLDLAGGEARGWCGIAAGRIRGFTAAR
jgi:hypothetical protein